MDWEAGVPAEENSLDELVVEESVCRQRYYILDIFSQSKALWIKKDEKESAYFFMKSNEVLRERKGN